MTNAPFAATLRPAIPPHLYRAGPTFRIKGKLRPGHPALVNHGGVILPVADYLAYLVLSRNQSPGSVEGVAFALKDWFGYLHDERVSWSDADDELLRRWAVTQETRIGKRRIQRKVYIVFDFYRTVQLRLGWLENVVGQNEIGRRFPLSYTISMKLRKGRKLVTRVEPSFRYDSLPKPRERATPTKEQIELITDKLLDEDDIERATCWWLCAGWMHRSGLRRAGVAGLTLSALSLALAEEGIIDPAGKPWVLPALANEPDIQSRIKEALTRLRVKHRRAVFVLVTEKGDKERKVPLPFEMLEHNLDYVWGPRAELVARRFLPRLGYKPCDALFLSWKTGVALKPKSIGNMIKSVFSILRIPGSGHRLRAAFACEIVRRAYLRARAAHGRAWDQGSILLEAAEAMGHARPETLLPYLKSVLREENALPGEPILVLSSDDARFVRALADALNEPASLLAGKLKAFLHENGIGPCDEGGSLDDIRRKIDQRRGSLGLPVSVV